jgi:hypothetical protein
VRTSTAVLLRLLLHHVATFPPSADEHELHSADAPPYDSFLWTACQVLTDILSNAEADFDDGKGSGHPRGLCVPVPVTVLFMLTSSYCFVCGRYRWWAMLMAMRTVSTKTIDRSEATHSDHIFSPHPTSFGEMSMRACWVCRISLSRPSVGCTRVVLYPHGAGAIRLSGEHLEKTSSQQRNFVFNISDDITSRSPPCATEPALVCATVLAEHDGIKTLVVPLLQRVVGLLYKSNPVDP